MDNRIGGYIDTLISCVNVRKKKYAIYWDKQEDKESEGNFTFMQHEFDHKPTLEEIKSVIISWYNAKIDNEILTGFVWKGMSVWLSTENQFNYKAAYDLCVQNGGQTLPVLFKFGDTENPIYHQFTTQEELSDFYIKAMQFISDTLSAGWIMKDTVDWNQYEECLKTI